MHCSAILFSCICFIVGCCSIIHAALHRWSSDTTEEFVRSTSSPFLQDRLQTWDFQGNTILNGRRPGRTSFKMRIGDFYSSDLLMDLFAEDEHIGPVGWSRVSLCNMLAIRKADDPMMREVDFEQSTCNDERLFDVGNFDGPADAKWARMDHCYKAKNVVNAYAKCLLRNIHTAEKKRLSDLEPCKEYDDGNVKSSIFASHLYFICKTNTEVLLAPFSDGMQMRKNVHAVRSFNIEVCHLHTVFTPGKMTICFPHSELSNDYSTECGYGNQKFSLEFENAFKMNIIVGNKRILPNAMTPLLVQFSKEAEEMSCRSIVFNRYKSIPGTIRLQDLTTGTSISKLELPPETIVVPTELLHVKGQFDVVADAVPVSVESTFSNLNLFIRIGRCTNTISCHWRFAPTLHTCNNQGGVTEKQCEFSYQTKVVRSTGVESSREDISETSVGVSISTVLEEALGIELQLHSLDRVQKMKKFLSSLQTDNSKTLTEQIKVLPGQRHEVWQLAYNCLGHKYFFPIFEYKNASLSDTTHYPFDEILLAQGRSAEEATAAENGREDSLPADSSGEILQHTMKMGICDLPHTDKDHNATACHYFKVPEDVINGLAKVAEKMEE